MRRLGIALVVFVVLVGVTKVYETTHATPSKKIKEIAQAQGSTTTTTTAQGSTTTTTEPICHELGNSQIYGGSHCRLTPIERQLTAIAEELQAKIRAAQAALAQPPPPVVTVMVPAPPTTLPYCTPEMIDPVFDPSLTYCAPNASDPPYYCPASNLTPAECAQLFPSAYRP